MNISDEIKLGNVTLIPNKHGIGVIFKGEIKELTADEMFEEIGYKKSLTQLKDLKYKKDDDNVIYFRMVQKTFNKSGEYDDMCDYTTMQELQAINKKCKELGWI